MERLLPAGDRRVLLVTMGFGDGHNRAAAALASRIRTYRPGAVTTLLDPLSGPEAARWERQRAFYYWAVRRWPRTYQRAYQCLARSGWALEALALPLQRWLSPTLEVLRPDVVVSSHVFPAFAAQRLAGRGAGFRTAGLVTDLVDDAYWNRTRLDLYLVGTGVLRDRLARAGVPRGTVLVTGLPVESVFHERTARPLARERLGLRPEWFTVLVLGGGEGFGGIREATAALGCTDLPIQVVVVAGRNEPLRGWLELLRPTARVPLTVVGFTERIHEYMDAADVAVTKPGGMTVAECLAKELPMVLFGRPLSGPESQNQGYLVEHGLAVAARDCDDLLHEIKARAQLAGAGEVLTTSS